MEILAAATAGVPPYQGVFAQGGTRSSPWIPLLPLALHARPFDDATFDLAASRAWQEYGLRDGKEAQKTRGEEAQGTDEQRCARRLLAGEPRRLRL
jgi:hypothetical protein